MQAQAEAQKRHLPAPPFRSGRAPVEKADFPVYLTGLGTVQGFNTVVVRTRVDGQINRIAFKEGQFVKQGDTLVEIDPRPFQAALDQAKAKKAQDEANLANANLDLQRFTKLGEFATRQQTDTQRSTVAQLTAQIAGRRRRDRQRADPARLRHRQGADLRRRGPAPGRRRQHRQCRDADRHRDHRPDRADRGDLHRAGRPAAGHQGSACGRSRRRRSRCRPTASACCPTGTLALINNQVDTTSGTIRLKAVFDNKDHALWPGQSVSTRLLVATLKDATVVPDDAVQHGADGLYAYHGQRGQQGRAAQDQGDAIDRRPLGGR